MRILHTADWHIGPLPGPSADGKNLRAEDTLRCIDELIAKAESEQPDLCIIAGDIFHVSKTWSERGIHEVQDAIRRIELLSKIAPVVAIQGTLNHDGNEHFSMLQRYFSGNPDVSIFTKPGCYKVISGGYNSASKYVNICALPGFDKGYWRAQHPGIDREQESAIFAEDLEKMVIGLRAFCDNDFPSILVAHYTVEGANTESGQMMMFSQFEPVISHRALTAANYDLCCFGHIHRPQSLGANAYYSGAVNALNFNDEGQQRGFYIHTIEDVNAADNSIHHILTNSDGIALHPRKFKTVRLEGSANHDFNLSGLLPYNDVQDAIVRVIYDCTDEEQKALNRAALEKTLTDAGAFYVQEITPRNITVTVNRMELDTENNPEVNLRDYLTANDVPADDIRDAMELGRAIIDHVLAEGHNDKASGLFVPVEISVSNYRNYRNETFNIEDVRFATINGQNGVGKSSLFMDAIYDALFEEPREHDLTGWICNDPDARSGSIQFVFRVGDHLWRVSRTRMKSGKATLNLSEKVDGEWQDRSCERMKDTQAAVERVIGMDGQTLRACALIMQDQYGLFLQADKESRMQILSDVLGLSVYDDMAAEATERTADVNRELRLLQAKKQDMALACPDIEALRARCTEHIALIQNHDKTLERLNAMLDAKNAELALTEAASAHYEQIHADIKRIHDDIVRLKWQQGDYRIKRDEYARMLSNQSAILEGAERYRKAVEQRDRLQESVSTYSVKLEKKASTENGIKNSQRNLDEIVKRKLGIEVRIRTLQNELSHKDEYEHQQREHEQLEAAIKAAEEVNAEWHAADVECNKIATDISVVRTNARAEYRQRAADIEALKHRVALLNDSNCPISESATCRFLADAIKAKNDLPSAEQAHAEATEKDRAALEALEADLRAAESRREALQRVDVQMLTQMRERLSETAGASVRLAQMAQYAAELKLQEESLQEVTERENVLTYEIETAKSALAVIKAEIEQYELDYTTYKAALNVIGECRQYADMEQQLLGAQDRMAAAQERVDDFDKQIKESEQKLLALKDQIVGEGAAGAKLLEIKASIADVKREIETASKMRDHYVGQKASCEAEIEQAKELTAKIKVLSTEIAEKSRTASLYELLKAAFGTNGIPHNIIRGIIPVFEATASNILGQMSGGHMSVELVTEKVLKSNAKKEVTTLDVVVNDADTGRLPYLSRSGGERVKAALSVILALAEIMKSKLGVQLGFLAIDEAPFLDGAGVQAYCDALETIQQRYPDMKVMAITHDESFKARFPQSVTVTKDETGSHAVME